MTRIFSVEEMTGERTFDSTTNGVPSEVKVIGVKLTDGKNTLYAEAYRERAELVKNLNLQKGDIVQLQLNTSVKQNTKDGVTFYGNNVTIDTCLLLVRNSF